MYSVKSEQPPIQWSAEYSTFRKFINLRRQPLNPVQVHEICLSSKRTFNLIAVVYFLVNFFIWIITGDFQFDSSFWKCFCEGVAPNNHDERHILTSHPEPTWWGSFAQFSTASGTIETYYDLFEAEDWSYEVFHRVFNPNGQFSVLENLNQTVKVSQPAKPPLFFDLGSLSIAYDSPEPFNVLRLRGLDEIGSVQTIDILEGQFGNTQPEIRPND
jgi:hypothetical protein